MEIVKPYTKMFDVTTKKEGIALLKKVEWCARISHRSEEKQTEESWERFVTSVVLNHGDWSVTEHASVTVEALVDRGVMAEWRTHRLGAYTVESTRFVNYSKRSDIPVIRPEGMNEYAAYEWWEGMNESLYRYDTMLASGAPPQIARSVLPFSLATMMVVTYNLRNWRHFFLMRTTREAHPQMREITIPLLEQFQACIPILYDDIKPNERQVDNLAKAR